VAALALGTTIGQTLVAVPMVIATRRFRGPAAVQGIGHATLSGLVAGAAGAAVGVAVCLAAPTGGKLLAVGVAVLAASGAVIAFGVVAFILDRGDLKTVVARLRRLVRSRT
jgi:putative peptidoglycan lipid II flippase